MGRQGKERGGRAKGQRGQGKEWGGRAKGQRGDRAKRQRGGRAEGRQGKGAEGRQGKERGGRARGRGETSKANVGAEFLRSLHGDSLSFEGEVCHA